MVKRSFSVALILSAATLTSGVLFASMNPAQALPCPFAKNNDFTTTSENTPPVRSTQVDTDSTDTNNMGIIGGGIAAVVGLAIAGIAYKVRLAGQKAEAFMADVSQEETFSAINFPIPVSPEVLSASTSQQESSDTTVKKDLTLVG